MQELVAIAFVDRFHTTPYVIKTYGNMMNKLLLYRPNKANEKPQLLLVHIIKPNYAVYKSHPLMSGNLQELVDAEVKEAESFLSSIAALVREELFTTSSLSGGSSSNNNNNNNGYIVVKEKLVVIKENSENDHNAAVELVKEVKPLLTMVIKTGKSKVESYLSNFQSSALAEEVIQKSTSPVLVIADHHHHHHNEINTCNNEFRRMIVAYDGSINSHNALIEAIHFGNMFSVLNILILHVSPTFTTTRHNNNSSTLFDSEDFKRTTSMVSPSIVVDSKILYSNHSPSNVISSFVNDNPRLYDLVVFGRHGSEMIDVTSSGNNNTTTQTTNVIVNSVADGKQRSWNSKIMNKMSFLVGTTAERLIRQIHCPCLIVGGSNDTGFAIINSTSKL